MGYHIVFDVTQVGFRWWIPGLVFVFGGLFVLIGWAVKTSGDRQAHLKGLLFQLVGAVAVVAACGWFGAMYREYHAAEKALAAHDYSVAEGIVTNFVPMPPGGHAIESFTIGSAHFAYGSGWGSTTFNSEWNTGFLHEGVQARIAYRGKDILKVEVK